MTVEDDFDLPDPPAAPAGADGGGAFDQADIDALFGDVGTAAPTRSGLRALVENDSVRQERLPMLEVICDRVLRSFATAMRNLTSDAIDASLDGVSSGRFGDLMNHAPLPAMFGVFRVPEWSDYGVIIVEPALIYSAVDALLGGGKTGERQQRIEGRAFTPIETSLVGKLMQLALDELATSFASVAAISMPVERIETSPRFAAIAGPTTTTAVCTFGVEIEGKTGRFTVLLPYPCIEPVRDKLLQRFMGEKPGGDAGWSGHVERELRATPLDLGAQLTDREFGLNNVRGWKVGDVVPLGVGPDDPLTLLVEGVPLAAGLIGRKGGTAAVRLTSPLGAQP